MPPALRAQILTTGLQGNPNLNLHLSQMENTDNPTETQNSTPFSPQQCCLIRKSQINVWRRSSPPRGVTKYLLADDYKRVLGHVQRQQILLSSPQLVSAEVPVPPLVNHPPIQRMTLTYSEDTQPLLSISVSLHFLVTHQYFVTEESSQESDCDGEKTVSHRDFPQDSPWPTQ